MIMKLRILFQVKSKKFYNKNKKRYTLEQFNQLNLIKYQGQFNQDNCRICLDNFKINEDIINLRNNHIFHVECLKKHFVSEQKNFCPLCRNSIIN